MIRPLRKYHFFLWRIVAFLLPILFVAAIYFRPPVESDYKRDKNDFSFNVRTLTDSTAQINIDVNNPLKTASCVVFLSLSSRDILLGKLERQGKHRFQINHPIDKDIRIRLFDILHQKEITKVQLTASNK